MAFAAKVFGYRGEAPAQFRMPFGRAMACLALNILKKTIGIFDKCEASGMAGQAGGVRCFVFLG